MRHVRGPGSGAALGVKGGREALVFHREPGHRCPRIRAAEESRDGTYASSSKRCGPAKDHLVAAASGVHDATRRAASPMCVVRCRASGAPSPGSRRVLSRVTDRAAGGKSRRRLSSPRFVGDSLISAPAIWLELRPLGAEAPLLMLSRPPPGRLVDYSGRPHRHRFSPQDNLFK